MFIIISKINLKLIETNINSKTNNISKSKKRMIQLHLVKTHHNGLFFY